MKKIIISSVIALLSLSYSGGFMPVKASSGDISLLPADKTLTAGQSFDLEVHLDSGGKSVGAIDAYIDFDAAKLKLADVPVNNSSSASAYNMLYNDSGKAQGHLRFSAICAQSCLNSSNVHIVTVHMQALAAFSSGSTDVTIRLNELTNELGIAIPVGTISLSRLTMSGSSLGTTLGTSGNSSGSGSGISLGSGTASTTGSSSSSSSTAASSTSSTGVIVNLQSTSSLQVVIPGRNDGGLSVSVNENEANVSIKPGAEAVVITAGSNTIVKLRSKDDNMYKRLKGRIIIKPEDKGKAYYVSVGSQEVLYLGRPADAFSVMRQQGRGIKTAELKKVPVAATQIAGVDTDKDGLADSFEDALGTNKLSKDSDGDGYDDKIEVFSSYDPKGSGKMANDPDFSKKQEGKIFIQVENKGEAWYIYSGKRYYMGRPADAYNLMRKLGLGVSNADFSKFLAE